MQQESLEEVVIPGDEDESAECADRSSHQGEAGDMAYVTASESRADRSRRAKLRSSANGGALLQMEAHRFNLKRGTNLAVWQSITRRGREPTGARIDPIWSVSRCYRDSQGDIGYRTDHRIRGPNLIANALKSTRRREGPMNNLQCSRPRCQGETRAGDIATKSFICGTRCPGGEGDAAG